MAESAPETIRLHQANERTMLAWVRTGIALMAFGFAIARFGVFLRQVAALTPGVARPHSLESGWLGTALVGVGMLANLTATLRFAQTRKAIERGDVGAPSATAVYVVGGAATLIGLAMAILLARALADLAAAEDSQPAPAPAPAPGFFVVIRDFCAAQRCGHGRAGAGAGKTDHARPSHWGSFATVGGRQARRAREDPAEKPGHTRC